MLLILVVRLSRYDCRGNMAAKELAAAESRVEYGSVNWQHHMSPEEQRAERLCDEERYRALHTDEDEEEMYRGEGLVFWKSWLYLFRNLKKLSDNIDGKNI